MTTFRTKPDTDGGFTAWVVEIPGIVSDGATEPEALRNLAEAFEGVLDVIAATLMQVAAIEAEDQR